MDGDGAAEAVEPLLLVEDVIDLECVGLALGWVLETSEEATVLFKCLRFLYL